MLTIKGNWVKSTWDQPEQLKVIKKNFNDVDQKELTTYSFMKSSS